MTGGDPPGIRCPHCGYRVDPDEEHCPLCGTRLEGTDVRGRAGRHGQADEAADPEARGEYRGAAWDREGGRFPDDFLLAWKESLLSPSRFFSALEPGGSLWRAILFYLVLSVVGSGLSLMWNAWTGGGGGAAELYRVIGLAPGQFQLLVFLAAPFLALLAWAFFTLVFHLLVLLFVDHPRGVGETARVLSYAWSSPQALQVVPFLGGLVGGVWSVVLLVVGFREHHRTSTLRSAAVVLLPLLVFVAIPMLLVLAVVLGGLGGGLRGLPGA